jgi:hypothetical protein
MGKNRYSMSQAVALSLLITAAAGTLVGCGGSAGVGVSGTVNVNGAPLQTGKITFRPLVPAAGNGGSAQIVDGNYQLTDVPIGANVFTFSGSVLTGKSIPGPGGAPEPERVNAIPRQILIEGVEREISASGPQDFSLDGPV